MFVIIPVIKLLLHESNNDNNHRWPIHVVGHVVVPIPKVGRDDIPALKHVPILGRHGGLLAYRRDRQVTGLHVFHHHLDFSKICQIRFCCQESGKFLSARLDSCSSTPWREQLKFTAISSRNLYRIRAQRRPIASSRLYTYPFRTDYHRWIIGRSGPIAFLLSHPHPRSMIRRKVESGVFF